MEELRLVNLDLLIEEFNRFRQRTSDLVTENLSFSKQVDLLNRSLQQVVEEELIARTEVKTLQDILETAQRSMTDHCNVQDESTRLKKEVECVKRAATEHEQKYESRILELKREMEAQQLCHAADQVRLEDVLKAQFKESSDKQKQILEELIFQNEQLQRQMKEIEREKEAEIMKQRIEYESKLMKLQRQLTASTAPSQLSSVSQEIFRKKLKNIQMESEKEIAGLKLTISTLQQALASAQDQLQIKTQASCPFKRPKKF